jgi:hypothetical protein
MKKSSDESNNKNKRVIIYLTRSNNKDITNLKYSLQLLYKNFNVKFNYPIIVFHEGLNSKIKEDIKNNTKMNIKFEKVVLSLPTFLSINKIKNSILRTKTSLFGIGYRNMCRFFSKMLYNMPILKNYDWYLRLDVDSFILNNIDYDIFEFMEKNNYLYGYVAKIFEPSYVTKNLVKETNNYLKNIKIETASSQNPISIKWDHKIYYNNFEISNFKFWRSNKVKQFLEFLDKKGGIYYFRWGDAPIHTLAINMFMDRKKKYQFKDIAYYHQNFYNISYKEFNDLLSRLPIPMPRSLLRHHNLNLKNKFKYYKFKDILFSILKRILGRIR